MDVCARHFVGRPNKHVDGSPTTALLANIKLNKKCCHDKMVGHSWATEIFVERPKDPVSTCSKAQGAKLSLSFLVKKKSASEMEELQN